MIELPAADALRRLLDFNPATGKFTWLPRGNARWDARWAGREAFACTWNGYKVGSLCGRSCVLAHRVAFKHFYGADAPCEVDHINGDRSDNRIVNLRAVNASENRRNGSVPSHNSSGIVGVAFRPDKGRWRASISIGNASKHIGYYASEHDARIARKAAEKVLGFHPNHGKSL